MRARLFAVAALLFLAGCGSTSPSGGITYAAYTYNCCAELTGPPINWHAGDRLTLHWTAIAGQPTTDNTPHPMKLRLTLTGPFATVNALKDAMGRPGRIPAGVRSIDAVTPAVTDRTGGAPVSELDLPGDLAAGYYNLATDVSTGESSAGGATIITIQ